MLRERWHFCRDGRVLLGSRALRERHLGLMGYQLLPVRPRPIPRPAAPPTPCHTTPPLDPAASSPDPRDDDFCPLPRSYPLKNWSPREACPSSRAT